MKDIRKCHHPMHGAVSPTEGSTQPDRAIQSYSALQMATYWRRIFDWYFLTHIRTSDGGNGNHSVSLPIILIKI